MLWLRPTALSDPLPIIDGLIKITHDADLPMSMWMRIGVEMDADICVPPSPTLSLKEENCVDPDADMDADRGRESRHDMVCGWVGGGDHNRFIMAA